MQKRISVTKKQDLNLFDFMYDPICRFSRGVDVPICLAETMPVEVVPGISILDDGSKTTLLIDCNE